MQLVRDLWTQGVSADLLYDSMEKDNMEDVQQFCKDYKIPHLIVLGDKSLLINGKVKRRRGHLGESVTCLFCDCLKCVSC